MVYCETLLNDLQHNFFTSDVQWYNMVEKHRPTRFGRGVAIYIKASIEHNIGNDIVTFNE